MKTKRRTLQEQAWQSGLALWNQNAEWNPNDWPPLTGGWRRSHASIVLDHPHPETDHNNQKTAPTVVVIGGSHKDQGELDSVLILNLNEPNNKQWREGPPLNQSRAGHAAVVCHGRIYVVGGEYGDSCLDSIEWIQVNDLLLQPSSSSTNTIHWRTFNQGVRLSTPRTDCCAVAVHNRYIVVMGGWNWSVHSSLSSVEIVDTRNDTVVAGPRMNGPRFGSASAVLGGHRIFVVGGSTQRSVEYMDCFKPCYCHHRDAEILPVSVWKTHADLVLSVPRNCCAMAAVGSCLVVAGGGRQAVDVLDTTLNRVWKLPPLPDKYGSMVALATHIAVIGGAFNPSCATLPLLDKRTWCFLRLCEQPPPNGWYYDPFRERNGN